MKITIILILYGIAFYWGYRKLVGKNRNLHRLWYGCILAWCAYVHLSGITGTRHISISSLYTAYFQPATEVIIRWLGG